jgi:hypothetical protein
LDSTEKLSYIIVSIAVLMEKRGMSQRHDTRFNFQALPGWYQSVHCVFANNFT